MRRTFLLVLCLLFLATFCAGQGQKVYVIDTVAGGAVYGNLPATGTPLSSSGGLWFDRDGALWIVDTGNQVIRRVEPSTSIARVVIGGGTVLDDSIPVSAASVRLDRPTFVTGDSAGNVYFSDTGNNRIRKMTTDGQVATFVGTGQPGFSGDGGPARLARLDHPAGIAFDNAGNLYIADAGNCRIRRVDTAGTITTFSGNGQCGVNSGDGGLALNAGLGFALSGLALDSRGNLYFINHNTVRRIDRSTGIISTVVGNGVDADCNPFPDGTSATARGFCNATSVLFDPSDNLYFTHNSGLSRVAAGTTTVSNVSIANLTGLARDPSGKLFAARSDFGQVLQFSPSGGPGVIVAGTDDPFDGPGRFAILTSPGGLAVDPSGNVYLGERSRNRLRRFDPATGLVSTLTSGAGGVVGLATDLNGNVYVSQINGVSKLDPSTGTLTRIAGAGLGGSGTVSSGDGGPALQATFAHTQGIVVDRQGNIFVADWYAHRVRRIDAVTGIITTVAGNGTFAYSGDGGPATAASVGSPQGLAIDGQGNLLIASDAGPALRRVNLATGVITTVQVRSSPGGPLQPATNQFGGTGGPWAMAVDGGGNIFVTSGGLRVDQIGASDSLLTRIAGSTRGFFGDSGLATLARLSTGAGQIGLDPSGNIYVADADNGRLRKLSPTLLQPSIAISPATLFFTQAQASSVLLAGTFSISTANGVPFDWTLDVTTSAGGNWLIPNRTSGSAPANVTLTVDAARLGPGTYRGTVNVRAQGASNSPQTVEVALTVTGASGAVLGISQQFLSFAAVQGGANPPTQSLSISNAGSGTLSWSAASETSNGGPWLGLSSTTGTAPSTLTISVNITGLAQGVYQGKVIVRNLLAGETSTIAVVLVVTKTQPILLPAQTGFLFVGVEGSLVIGPQSFAIQNAGQGTMDWQVQVNLPGGGDWLRVSPLSGTSVAGQAAPSVTLLVDPSKLRAGVSVGLLTITGTGASNSPQTGIVLVNMLARGSLPVGTINPLGLIFTSQAGATGTLTQGLTIASTGGQALQFLARTRTQAGGNWLTVTPEQGVLLSSAETASLSLQANPSGLSTGVYFGAVTLNFGTGVNQEVAVALVVTPAATTALGPRASGLRTEAAACTPRRLVVVETKLGNLFSVQVGWPVPMLVKVVDDCGTAVTSATVTASFTSGEAPLAFQNLRDGTYSATWVPVTQAQVGVTARAVNTGLEDGVAQFAGSLGMGSTLPLVYRDGWVNAASFDRFKPLAPGMIFSVFGNNLADGKNFASAVPLPRSLGNLKVTLGGVDAPLFYADGGQVNAQVPFELATVGTASLVASGRGSAGAPGTVTIVGAQPGVFTISQSGTGQGVVLDAQFRIADSTNPVKAGDAVQIYATGLGLANPAIESGVATPNSPLSNVATPVKITIGGLDAVVDFAGLAPGFVGLYQVNARVPSGVTASSAVPLVITQNGVASNTVTFAVR